MPATKVFWALIAGFAVVLAAHVVAGDIEWDVLGRDLEFGYRQTVTIHGSPGRFRLTVFIPEEIDGLDLRDEVIESPGLELHVEQDDEGRRIVVEGDSPVPARTVRYTARIASRPVAFRFDGPVAWKGPEGSEADLDSTATVQVRSEPVQDLLLRLFDLSAAERDALRERRDGPAAWQAVLAAKGVGPLEAVRTIHEFCLRDIAPAGFSGTTDALTALQLGEASCGGKSRLELALARTLGIPGRIVGGVILGNRVEKRTSHVWVELRLGDRWVPFDPLNGHSAELPATYLRLYRGDRPLIVHSRGLAFDYGFAAPAELVPRAWKTETNRPGTGPAGALSRIPLLRRQHFSVLLLAPFALLLVVFARHVVGVDSIGTFLPVLLGFSVLQTGWILGAAEVGAAVLLGLVVRLLLGRVGLLHVPRTAILITFVVVFFLGLSTLLDRMGSAADRSGVLLPMAALAMTVERYAFVSMDRGNRAALGLLAQTLALAAACRLVLSVPFLKAATVAFPEILLLVVADIVVLGNYRGLRLTELWRFRHVDPHAPPEAAR